MANELGNTPEAATWLEANHSQNTATLATATMGMSAWQQTMFKIELLELLLPVTDADIFSAVVNGMGDTIAKHN
jgi:hypothetical protein